MTKKPSNTSRIICRGVKREVLWRRILLFPRFDWRVLFWKRHSGCRAGWRRMCRSGSGANSWITHQEAHKDEMGDYDPEEPCSWFKVNWNIRSHWMMMKNRKVQLSKKGVRTVCSDFFLWNYSTLVEQILHSSLFLLSHLMRWLWIIKVQPSNFGTPVVFFIYRVFNININRELMKSFLKKREIRITRRQAVIAA